MFQNVNTNIICALLVVSFLFSSDIISEEAISLSEDDPIFSEIKPNISGIIDTYYASTDIRFTDRTRPYVTQAIETDGFSLNHGLVNLDREGEGFRYALGVHTGTYVQANYSQEPEQMQYIYQGWGGVALAKGLWLDLGIFPSHLGGESTISADNFTYTRSLVAEGSPYYETGARLVWGGWEDWQLSFYILNGWQQIRNQNRDLAGGIQVEYKISENWMINYGNFIGNEAPDSEKRQTQYFNDFYVKGKVFDWMEVYFLYDIGFKSKADSSWFDQLEYPGLRGTNTAQVKGFHKWEGFTLQFYFHLNKFWKLGIRGEGFYDPHQIVFRTNTDYGYQLESGSLNIDYLPNKHAIMRLEIKHNSARDKIYRDESGKGIDRENLAVISLAIVF